ncbi:MAG: hypothetical protein AB7G80_02000 [Dongiaceae bacterium]
MADRSRKFESKAALHQGSARRQAMATKEQSEELKEVDPRIAAHLARRQQVKVH